ncbi:MAG: nitronate monooxygenase [Ferruginibacter sp.]|mgnify:CR=1 FL=1|nr:nitronate monooxygenase [Bacteroidota bacterium]MBX2919704.1 nitronate monooxygenase [Ferruginibacter sp.]MCC7379137.1 nitronate monooxygenase [Chitinophagaceae bacterium]
MNHSCIQKLFSIKYPILQGPFGGGLSSVELVAAVSNAGGLGGYGAYQLQPGEIEELIADIRKKTNQPFNINLWVNDADIEAAQLSDENYAAIANNYKPFFDELNIPLPPKPEAAYSKFEQQAEVILKCKPAVFSFVFGIPDKTILIECKKQGIKTIGAATTLDEAVTLEEANVDAIIASGFEAGGHRPSFLKPAEDSLHGTFVLVSQIAKNVKTPVIAAGGIADAGGVKATMELGASAVQIGTAFLACKESGASDIYRSIIFSDRAKYTTLTKSFTGRLGRGTSGVVAENSSNLPTLPFPLQTKFMSPLRKAAEEQGKTEMLTYWMGQNASLVKFKDVNTLFKSLLQGFDE